MQELTREHKYSLNSKVKRRILDSITDIYAAKLGGVFFVIECVTRPEERSCHNLFWFAITLKNPTASRFILASFFQKSFIERSISIIKSSSTWFALYVSKMLVIAQVLWLAVWQTTECFVTSNFVSRSQLECSNRCNLAVVLNCAYYSMQSIYFIQITFWNLNLFLLWLIRVLMLLLFAIFFLFILFFFFGFLFFAFAITSDIKFFVWDSNEIRWVLVNQIIMLSVKLGHLSKIPALFITKSIIESFHWEFVLTGILDSDCDIVILFKPINLTPEHKLLSVDSILEFV